MMWPEERIDVFGGFPALTYLRRGSSSLIVFVTGAGHLARVAYGAPSADDRDFLAHWVLQTGASFLAVSHPAEHPVFPRVYPELTVSDWAELVLQAIQSAQTQIGTSGPVIVVGWSMGGRLAASLGRAARAAGVTLDCFISLSGTPPLPGLLSTPRNDADGLTEQGLWDPFSPRLGWQWQDALAEQDAINGHAVVDVSTYRDDYCGATPIRLRGGTLMERDTFSLEEISADLNSFNYADYPVVGVIRPTRQSDALHALADRETWGYLNAQVITSVWLADYVKGRVRLAAAGQRDVVALMDSVPGRLTRSVDGGHLFFLGEAGARATARFIVDLHDEATTLRREFAALLAAGANPGQQAQ